MYIYCIRYAAALLALGITMLQTTYSNMCYTTTSSLRRVNARVCVLLLARLAESFTTAGRRRIRITIRLRCVAFRTYVYSGFHPAAVVCFYRNAAL